MLFPYTTLFLSVQSQRWVGRLLPIIGAAPAIAPKPQSDLDSQIFRQDDLDAAGVAVIVKFTARRLAQLALNVAFGNRAPDIGIGHIEILRLQVRLRLDQLLRPLVEHAECTRVIALAVSEAAKIIQLILKHALRPFVTHFRQLNDETFQSP